MGNQIACCRQKWSPLDDSVEKLSVNRLDKVNFSYQNAGAVFHNEVWSSGDQFGCGSEIVHPTAPKDVLLPVHSGVTQHISEREPEDVDYDPSLNASQRALFITASATSIKHEASSPFAEKASRFHLSRKNSRKHSSNTFHRLKKWSSCSTVYIGDGCLVHPHQETTLWSVAVAIELLARSPKNLDLSSLLVTDYFSTACSRAVIALDSIRVYDDVYKLYDERKYLIGQPSSDNSLTLPKPDFVNNPKASDVHGFLRGLFSTALLAPQCAIVALIFLERLINAAEVGLLPWSWRRQLLSCLILASKLLDDQAVWNTDYCQVLRDLSVDDLNALERHTLSLLQFNVDIPPSVYARYYFDLLSVGEAHGVANKLSDRRRLTPELARHLRILPTRPEPRSPKATAVDTRLLFDLPRTDEPLPSSDTIASKPAEKTLGKTFPAATQPQQIAVSSLDVKPLEVRPYPSDSCTSVPVLPPFASSSFNQFPSPPDWTPTLADDPLTDNEPLTLDDETDFINSLTISTIMKSAPPVSLSPDDAICDIASLNNPIRSPQSLSPVQWNPTEYANIIPGQRLATQCGLPTHAPSAAMYNPIGNAGTGFIRSIMGGEVAYSLLRDAGMY